MGYCVLHEKGGRTGKSREFRTRRSARIHRRKLRVNGHKTKMVCCALIIAFAFSMIFSITSPNLVQAQKAKFDVSFEIDDRYMTFKTLYITVTNLQDSSDFITMKTILSSTDFSIFDVTDVDFAIGQNEIYQVSVPDYGWVEEPIYDNENNLVDHEDGWRIVGWHSEDRERLVWKSKELVNKTEDGLKGELKNQWEEVPIQKAGQAKDTLCFRFEFSHPIVEREDGWGSKGIISLDLNGEVFVDLEASSWWNSSWPYRAPITLTIGENVPPENYPYKIVFAYSHAMDNYQDLRFLENSSSGELSHWIENYVPEDNVTVWVNREINALSDNEIYIYWGNSSAASVENGEATFDFFDDFNSDNSKWVAISGAATVSGGKLTIDDDWIRTTATYNENQAIRAYGKMSATTVRQELGFSTKTTVGGGDIANEQYSVSAFWHNSGTTYLTNFAAAAIQVDGGAYDTSYTIFDIIRNFTTNTQFLYDGTAYANTPLTTNIPSQNAYIHILDAFDTAGYSEWDWLFVRKFVSPEPTASIGVEESLEIDISSISVDENVIDVDVDDASSGAVASTQITVRVRGHENRDNIESVYIWIRDNNDAVTVDNLQITDNTIIDENTLDFTYTYNPADNLPNDNLGMFDVRVVAFNNLGENATEDYTDKGYQLFTVDDATSSITFGVANPYYWWEENATGTVTRVSGATASADNVWYTDAVEGTWYLGSGNSWNQDNYTINSLPGENVTVTVTIYDPPLDGLFTSSYVVNENWQFQLNLRWEDNFEYVDDNTVENVKNWWVEFWFADYETHEEQLTSTSNLVITAYESDTLRVTDRDENYHRTYRTNRENIDVFMVADNSLPLLTAYLLSLDDPSTRWGPLNDGAIMIYKLIENEVAYINDSYWMATSDVSLYMIRPDVYSVRLEAPGLTTLDYGRLDADLNTSKIISPGLGSAEYGVEIINIHYMVVVRYWTTEDNHLMIFYQDNYEETNWVRFIIRNVDGDVLWETLVEDVNEYTAEFTEIDIDNIYDIGIRFDHDTYGAVRLSFVYIPYYYSESVVPPVPSSSPGGLDILGDPPVSWGYLITFTILMLVLVSFGPGHSGIAVLAMAMTGTLLNLTEIIVIGWELIFFLIVIGILTQIFEARKGGGPP